MLSGRACACASELRGLGCVAGRPSRTCGSCGTVLHSMHAAPQGIECRFLEQWHQKLHTNTTPEDISICEGYLVRTAAA